LLAQEAEKLLVPGVHDVQVCQIERGEGPDERGVELGGVVLRDVVERVRGGDADAGAAGPDLLGDGRRDFDREPDAVPDRAAVAVGAAVRVGDRNWWTR
jgi:hypothetical protein